MLPLRCYLFAAVLLASVSVNLVRTSNVFSAMSKARVNIALCRTACLNQIAPQIYEDGECEATPNCNMCWKTCEMFYNNFTVWGPMCDERKICFPGCQVSCAFYRSRVDAIQPVSIAKEQWDMDPIQFHKKDIQEELLIEWTRPERLDQSESSTRLVYVVMLKVNERWIEIGQTLQTSMLAEDYRYSRDPTYITILVYSERGLVAERTDVYNMDSNDVMYSDQYMPPPKKVKEGSRMNASPAVFPSSYNQLWTLYLASLTTKKSCFGVEATVMWDKSPKCGVCKYEVSWKAQDSRYDVTGSLYTSDTIVTVNLWPGYVHTMRVKCLDDNGAVCDASESLNVDTKRALSEVALESEPQKRANCEKTFLLEGLLVMLCILGVIFLVCLIICLVLFFRQRKINPNAQVENGKRW